MFSPARADVVTVATPATLVWDMIQSAFIVGVARNMHPANAQEVQFETKRNWPTTECTRFLRAARTRLPETSDSKH
jgi:hypothetical protein